MLLSVFGISWATYIRIWQLFLWKHCQDEIQEALNEGYSISSKWWRTEVQCVNPSGDLRIWKGGLRGET